MSKPTVILSALVVVSLTGCAWISPEPTWPEPVEREKPPTLSQGITYAQSVQKQLADRIGSQTKVRNSIAAAQILLLGAVAADAVIDPSDDAITIASTLAAMGFGAGQYYDNQKRQDIFGLGIQTINCAIAAVDPLHGVDSANLAGNLNALIKEYGNVRGAQTQLELLAAINGNQSAVEIHIANSDAALTAAGTSYKKGELLIQAHRSSGSRLQTATDRILAQVIGGVLQTNASLASLKGIVKGLVFDAASLITAPNVTAFSALSSPLPGSTETLEDRDPAVIEQAIEKLARHTGQLEALSLAVEATVDGVDLSAAFQILKEQCNVDVGEVIQSLAVVPANLVFIKDKDQKNGVTISGGNGKFAARILGQPDGLRATQPEPFSSMIDVHSDGTAEVMQYRLIVQDTSGKQIIVPINVVGSDAGQDTTNGSPKAPAGDETVKSLQETLTSLGFDTKGADGLCGKDTDTAIQAFFDVAGMKEVIPEQTCNDAKALEDAIGQLLKLVPPQTTINKDVLTILVFETLWNRAGGEAVVVDGVADANEPHTSKDNSEVEGLISELLE